MNFKKFLASSAISGAVLLSLATPAFAARPAYGEQLGYLQASDCGSGHGSFAFFDGDTNLGVNSIGPGTPTYHDGLVGQESTAEEGATGYNNSHLCGNPQS